MADNRVVWIKVELPGFPEDETLGAVDGLADALGTLLGVIDHNAAVRVLNPDEVADHLDT